MQCRAFAAVAVITILCAVGIQCRADVVNINLDIDPAHLALSKSSKFSISSTNRLIQRINIPGFSTSGSSGDPALPSKLFYVALPPNADEESIKVNPATFTTTDVAGAYDVPPVPPIAAGGQVESWGLGKQISNGRNQLVYTRNQFYPSEYVRVLSVGHLRSWKVAAIEYWPYRYNPSTGKLRMLVSQNIGLSFDIDQHAAAAATDPLAGKMSSFIANREQASAWYPSVDLSTASQMTGYAIITTDAIASSSAKLADFAAFQALRGFNAMIITESQWGGGKGNTAAERIRNWLKANYLAKDIEYVLLIGNPDPANGDVPMKMLWPRHNYTSYKEAPSDYYYADLTGNWDRDGDGYYGEEVDDFGTGGVDRIPEVYIGRMPYYGSVADLDYILQKTMQYESTDLGQWSNRVLLPIKPLDDYTQCYQLGEKIAQDVAHPQGFTPVRIYDNSYSLNPAPELTPCDYDEVESQWLEGAGFVFWISHGSSTVATGIAASSRCGNLNDFMPSIVYEGSCFNGKPEDASNLGYSLLKHGAISTLSATRVSWYYIGENDYTSSDSIGGIGYQYARFLMQSRESCARAIMDARLNVAMTIWMNHVVMNTYGDPSLVFDMPAPGALSGRLTTVTGDSISDALIRTNDGTKSTLSQSDGSYFLSGLPPGAQDIEVIADGFYPQRFYDLPFSFGTITHHDFRMVPCESGAIRGTVRDTAGVPVASVLVSTDSGSHTIYTSSDGSYQLNNLSPGYHCVTAAKFPYAQKTAVDCSVTAGASTTVDIVLRQSTGNVVLNGGFEDGFTDQIGNHWQFYVSHGYYAGPVAGVDYYKFGSYSQEIHLPQPTADGHSGIYQIVNVVPGQTYSLTAFERDYFSGSEANPSDNIACRIGYDPTGGQNYSSASVIWTSFIPGHQTWHNVSQDITPPSKTMTIFFDCWRKKAAGGDNCYVWFDGISLTGRVQAPSIPIVQVDDKYQSEGTRISASWSCVDNDIVSYEYAVSASVDESGIISGGEWSSVNANEATRSGLALKNGDIIRVLVRAINTVGGVSEIGVSEPVRIVRDVASVSAAKLIADGTWVRVKDARATRMGLGPECFIQDRIAGLKAISDWSSMPYISSGTKLAAAGCMATQNNMRVIASAEVMPSIAGIPVSPVFMLNGSVGGNDICTHDGTASILLKGSPWGRGVNNIGLLVTVVGRVSSVTPDGFALADGSMSTELPIICLTSLNRPVVGAFLWVTGISTPQGILVYDSRDIRGLQE